MVPDAGQPAVDVVDLREAWDVLLARTPDILSALFPHNVLCSPLHTKCDGPFELLRNVYNHCVIG